MELAEKLFRTHVPQLGAIGFQPFALIMALAQPKYTGREVAALFVNLARQNGGSDTISLHAFRRFICELCCAGVTFSLTDASSTPVKNAELAVQTLITRYTSLRPLLVSLSSALTLSTRIPDADAGVALTRILAVLDRELAQRHLDQYNALQHQKHHNTPQTGLYGAMVEVGGGARDVTVDHERHERLELLYKHILDLAVAFLAKMSPSRSPHTVNAKSSASAEPVCGQAELELLESLLKHRYVHLFAEDAHSEACAGLKERLRVEANERLEDAFTAEAEAEDPQPSLSQYGYLGENPQ
jgi:hypothetical protein